MSCRLTAARLGAPLSLILALLAFAALPAAGARAASLPGDWQKGADVTSWWNDDYAKGSSDQCDRWAGVIAARRRWPK